MSVTRLIPANTPSQVNAENIGVQIQLPPPTTVIDSITVNYNYETVDPSDLIYLDSTTLTPSDTPGLSCANLYESDGEGGLFNVDLIYDKGYQITIESDTYEQVNGFNAYEFYFNTTDGFQNGTTLYVIEGDGPGNYTATPTNYQIGAELTPSSLDLCIFEPMNEQTGYGQAIDTNGDFYELRKLGGNWAIFDSNNDCFLCFMDGTTNNSVTVEATPVNYIPGTPSEPQGYGPEQTPYWLWDSSDILYPMIGGGPYLGTLVAPENVKAGDTVIFSDFSGISWNYNRMTVSAVESHQEQDETLNCQVSYSVDGQTWTAYPDYLTDDNNVICNIPRYMFLKFSQDVLITEE